MQALHSWLMVFLVCGAGGGLFCGVALVVNAVMSRLDRLTTREPEPRSTKTRTCDRLYRPAAGEEPDRWQ